MSPIDDNFLSKLNFINSVQRLGVSYHFEHEIDEALHQMYEISTKENNIINYDDDLHHLALFFRLLRQQGYPISSGMTLPLLHQIYILTINICRYSPCSPCLSSISDLCSFFSLRHCDIVSF